MEKFPKFVPYDKASRSEQRRRNEIKRSPMKIPPNQIHKSAKDYDRGDEKKDMQQEFDDWGMDQ